ncbi:MAG: ATPase [Candidatus Melainabacteria bacterium HGW-Melainabacteria-1]|nr:MAG: ATPase [Candidatus Melainabacteria bacterium HGW-Melainabacteria-1]
MVDVLTETTIDAPLARVAEYAANPDHAPAWYVNINSAEWQTPKPLQLGSKITFVARFLGRTLRYTYEIVEFEPLQKLVMKTAEGPFPMETTYTWEAAGQGKTRMRLRNRGTPSGFSKLLAPLMAPAMKLANQNDLKLLKQILEKPSNA